MSNTIKLYASTTVKSAQSKKCRLLLSLRNKSCSLKLAMLKLKHDPLLQNVCSVEEIEAAANGTFAASAKRSFVVVEFTEEIEFVQPLCDQPQPLLLGRVVSKD